jgi:putative SOS response-associated peptidase YedK
MCYYNGIKVTHGEYERLKDLERKVASLNQDFAIHKGFDFLEFPIIRAVKGTHEKERVAGEWGFLPDWIQTREQAQRFRAGYKNEAGFFQKGFPCLNATSEELLNKIFKKAAKSTRCLVPSNGFYEWMHVQVVGKSGKLLKTPEKFPYLIQMRDKEEFYMAGVWNMYSDKETNTEMPTFAIITTAANTVMKQIHNSKERMPTILPGDLAEAWLYNDLSDDDILDIANYQAASADMIATPLHKDFLKRDNPHEEVIYTEVPELVYA